jgi:hypothetical protein
VVDFGTNLLRSGVDVVAHPDLADIPDPDRHAAALTAIDQAMRLPSRHEPR